MNYNIHDIHVHFGVNVYSGQNVIHQLMMDHNGVNSVTKLSCQTKLLTLLKIQVVSLHHYSLNACLQKKSATGCIIHFIHI